MQSDRSLWLQRRPEAIAFAMASCLLNSAQLATVSRAVEFDSVFSDIKFEPILADVKRCGASVKQRE